MSKSTSRAFRATATVAGMAALGATFAGTAIAIESDTHNEAASETQNPEYEGQGSTDYEAPSTSDAGLPTIAKDQLDGSTSEPGIHQPGLVNFQLPSLKTSTAGPEAYSIPAFDAHDAPESEYFQHPVEEEGNNVHEGNFQIAGHEVEFPSSFHTNNPTVEPVATQDDGTDATQDFGETPATSMMDGSSSEHGPGLSGHRMTAPL